MKLARAIVKFILLILAMWMTTIHTTAMLSSKVAVDKQVGYG